MDKVLDEALKIFLLSDRELRTKAEIEAIKTVKDDKYNSYDREFKNNFVKSFAQTYINEIEQNRENIAYTLLQNNYPKEIILKASRLTPKKLQEINIKENNADILMKYLENRKK